MAQPLVSVCIPTYNGEQFISDALDSIVSQSFQDYEVVVSDDNSSDNTLEIVEAYEHAFPGGLSVLRHEPAGIGANWNFAIRNSRGRYIKLLMQDDVLSPDCLSTMVDAFRKHPTAGLVFGRRGIIDAGAQIDVARWKSVYGSLHEAWSIPVSEGLLRGPELLRDRRLLEKPENKIGEPTTVMVSREALDVSGYFNTRLKQLLDFECWYRILRRFDAVFIDRELGKFRLHDTQASHLNRGAGAQYQTERLILLNSYMVNLWPCLSFRTKLEIASLIFRINVQKLKRMFARRSSFSGDP